VFAHGALKTLAAALMKIANDIRWLASGPRSGLGRDQPAGERAGQLDHAGQGQSDPGRSADDGVLSGDGQRRRDQHRGASGNFELNVFKPVIIYDFLQSTRLLSDAVASFVRYCVEGIQTNDRRIAS
jgi:fumarate hydratase class II